MAAPSFRTFSTAQSTLVLKHTPPLYFLCKFPQTVGWQKCANYLGVCCTWESAVDAALEGAEGIEAGKPVLMPELQASGGTTNHLPRNTCGNAFDMICIWHELLTLSIYWLSSPYNNIHLQAKSLADRHLPCFRSSLGSWLSKLASWIACQCPSGSPETNVHYIQHKYKPMLLYWFAHSWFFWGPNSWHEGSYLSFVAQASFRRG